MWVEMIISVQIPGIAEMDFIVARQIFFSLP